MVRKENPFLCNWCWSETTEWNVILIITMHAQSFLLCFLTQNKFELLIFNCRLENWDFLSHKLSIFFVVMTANWLFFFVCVDCKNFILFFVFLIFFSFLIYTRKMKSVCIQCALKVIVCHPVVQRKLILFFYRYGEPIKKEKKKKLVSCTPRVINFNAVFSSRLFEIWVTNLKGSVLDFNLIYF